METCSMFIKSIVQFLYYLPGNVNCIVQRSLIHCTMCTPLVQQLKYPIFHAESTAKRLQNFFSSNSVFFSFKFQHMKIECSFYFWCVQFVQCYLCCISWQNENRCVLTCTIWFKSYFFQQ